MAVGCGDGGVTATCNPSRVVDPLVFGAAHIYHHGEWGHDPVGLVAIWGALVSASAGATMGHLLLGLRRPRGGGEAEPGRGGVARAILPLLACAVGALLLAQLCIEIPRWAAGAEVLVMKRLWTAPFALRLAAPVAVALLLGHLLLDRRRVSRVTRGLAAPFVALGRNSLLVYFGSHVLTSVLNRPIELTAPGAGPDGADVVMTTTAARELADSLAVAGHPQLTYTALLLTFWVLLAAVLDRARVYLRP